VRPSARLLERKARGSGGERLTDSAISIVDRHGQRHALQIRSRRERRVRGTLAPAPRYPAGVQPNRLGRREGNGAARTTRHTLKSPRCTRRIDGSSGSARARSTRRLDAWSRASSPLALPTLLNVRHSGTFLSQHQEHVQCRPSAKVPPIHRRPTARAVTQKLRAPAGARKLRGSGTIRRKMVNPRPIRAGVRASVEI
jgi:hypothetical protein